MRFFHLSDLHIGLKLYMRDLGEDQKYILDEVIQKAVQYRPDAMLIAGDIYDRAVPSAEAVDLFDSFISGLHEVLPQTCIMMISGNHDSASRLNIFRIILKAENIYMIGQPPLKEEDHIEKVTLTDEYGPVNFYLLPFVRPSMVRTVAGVDENGNNLSYDETLHRLIGRENINPNERNVIVSHQFYLAPGMGTRDVERMDSETRTVGNIDVVNADMLDLFDYAALGHIHKPMKVGKESIRYSGTPIAVSLSEVGQQKAIVCVDMKEKGKTDISAIVLEPLRQVRIIRGTLDEVLKHGTGDYVRVELTDDKEFDSMDLNDRLRYAFPNLLEIRRDRYEAKGPLVVAEDEGEDGLADPFELCASFLGDDLSSYETKVLRDVINKANEKAD